jgi:chromosome segregation ATPase
MTKNNSKKKAQTNPRPVTEKILSQYIEKGIETLGIKIGETRKALEARIEYSRKDASEQIHGVQKAINARIDNVTKELKELKEDVKFNQQAIKSVKEDMMDMESRLSDKIDTRLDNHEAKPVNIAHRAA